MVYKLCRNVAKTETGGIDSWKEKRDTIEELVAREECCKQKYGVARLTIISIKSREHVDI